MAPVHYFCFQCFQQFGDLLSLNANLKAMNTYDLCGWSAQIQLHRMPVWATAEKRVSDIVSMA